MSAQASEKPTAFLNVRVTAVPQIDPVTKKVHYTTTFDPERVSVTEHDTVIAYQLVAPTPEGVRFKSVSVKPDRDNQLSDPSISESGKLVIFSDANTKKIDFHLTLHFKDSDSIEFSVDPEVANEPPPDAARIEPPRAMLCPEMPNEPPPDAQ